jgi:hypothetical protein
VFVVCFTYAVVWWNFSGFFNFQPKDHLAIKFKVENKKG